MHALSFISASSAAPLTDTVVVTLTPQKIIILCQNGFIIKILYPDSETLCQN